MVLGLLVMLMISGCTALGPDYFRPEADVESTWTEDKSSDIVKESTIDVKWWETAFQDDEINQLVETALQQNLTLRSAGLKVLQSQQQLAIAVGNQYPQQQQMTGLGGREKSGGAIFNDYNLGFNLSWEIDFWGRFSRQIESASAELDASVADYDNVIISLISQVAQTYILIRTY